MLCFLRDVDDEFSSEPTLRILRLLAENKTMIGLAALREIVGLLDGNERLVEALDDFLCDDLEFVVGKKKGSQVQLTNDEDVVVGLWRDKPAKREVSADNPETRQPISADVYDDSYSSARDSDEAASQQAADIAEEEASLAYARKQDSDEEQISDSQGVAETEMNRHGQPRVAVKQEEGHDASAAGTQRFLAPDYDEQPRHHGPTLQESYNQDDQQAARDSLTHEASEDEITEEDCVARQNEAYEPASTQDADEQAPTKCDLQDEALSLEALVSENEEDHVWPTEETALDHARGQVSSSRHAASGASDGEDDENLSSQATPTQDADLDCDRAAVIAGNVRQHPLRGDARNRDEASKEDEDVRLQADSGCKAQAIDELSRAEEKDELLKEDILGQAAQNDEKQAVTPRRADQSSLGSEAEVDEEGFLSQSNPGLECERRAVAARGRLYQAPEDGAETESATMRDVGTRQGPVNETQIYDPKKRMHGLANQGVLKRIKRDTPSTPTSSEEIPPVDDEQEQERETTGQRFKDNGEEDTSRAYATMERQVEEEQSPTPTTCRRSLVDQRVLKRIKRETASTPTNGDEIQQEQVQQHETTNQRLRENGEEDTSRADSTMERPAEEEQRSTFATGRWRDVTENVERQAQVKNEGHDAFSIGTPRQQKPKNGVQLQNQDAPTYQDDQQEAGDTSYEAPDDETVEVGDARQNEPEDADEGLVEAKEIADNAIQRLLANHPNAKWMAMKSNLSAEKTDYHNILHFHTRSTWKVGTVILATKQISPKIFLNLQPDGGPGPHYVIGVVVMAGDVDKVINDRDAVDLYKKDIVHRKMVVAFCRGGTMESLERDNCDALMRACRIHDEGVRFSEMWERAVQVLEHSERGETDLQ